MDVERAHIGHRIRQLRKWRNMDQAVVAGLAGISQPQLSKIERGKRAVNNRVTLERIAAALKVSPLEIVPDLDVVDQDIDPDVRTAMAALGDLLGGWRVGEVPDPSGKPLRQVLAELSAFQAARNSGGTESAGDYPTQVGILSPLIRDLLAAATDTALRRQVLPPLLTAYHVVGSISARLRMPGMPALAADRMREVADELDDPVWDAVGRWARAHFLSGTNRERQYELAVAVADSTSTHRVETRGMANLTAALAAAAQGHSGVAETHLVEAAALAELIERDVSPWPAGVMQFGRTNVGIFRVAVGVELGDGPGVSEVAETVRTTSISRGRQASFWIDYGRGLLAEKRTREKGIRGLLRAEELAPQQVHTNVWVRDAVTDLLPMRLSTYMAAEVRDLARRMTIAPMG